VGRTALVLGDQLSKNNPALDGAERVLLVESTAAMSRRRYHRRRRHLVLSAMRHFAAELRRRTGVEVVQKRGCASFADGLRGERDVACALPNSRAARETLARHGVTFVPSSMFLTDPDDFARWAEGQRRVRMEDFYREQRVRHGILVEDGDEPAGGRWNYDRENRRPATRGLTGPDPWRPREDEIDEEVRADLDRLGLPEFGVDGPREFPATRREALAALRHFVAERLPDFGPWQDTMVPGHSAMHHARLSTALNLWLLDPLEVARAAEDAYRAGDAPLASVEGFVRQVIGWREYVWGMYWWREPEWRRVNALGARKSVPQAYLDGETDANCLRTVVGEVREHGWANHIQRLMVLGNLGLLLGVRPQELSEWFHASFVDGAEWVMAPNVIGMALHADGGAMMTKPYAAGGNYISRMSGYCEGCRFDPKRRTGEDACPFTALYWDFVARHRDRWAENHRMRQIVRGLDRMDPGELEDVRARARVAKRRFAAAESA
jgi:deoxyribodipyrimidine photolyase-related protein